MWAVEDSKIYVFGVQFKVVLHHKAIMSVLKRNRGFKTFSSKLTRWVYRSLPFEFEVTHAAGRTLSMADYLHRHPSELQGASLKSEALWNEWFTVNSVISLKDVLEEDEATNKQARVKEIQSKEYSERICVGQSENETSANRKIHVRVLVELSEAK